MKYSTVAASAFIIATALPAHFAIAARPLRPPNDASCDDLGGYCHRRTTGDVQYVKWWNANKGGGNGNNPFKLRRRLGDVDVPPDYAPFAPGEYEAVEGILLAYDAYDLDVVAGIAAAVTVGNAVTPTKIFMVSNAGERSTWEPAFVAAGVDMALVEWIEEEVDSVWIRDYGPRFICDPAADVRAAVDTKYYTGRPNDDRLPTEIGNPDRLDHNNYDLNSVMHSGGNGHYFSNGKAFASRLLLQDNDGASEADLVDHWLDYKGAQLHLFDRLSGNVDGTGHIDMWFLPVDDTTVVVGEWAQEDRYGSKAVTDGAARYMAEQGYTVHRVRNWSSKKKTYGYTTHYTYTNAIIANDVVVLSSFNTEPEDSQAKAVFEAAFPTKTILQVDSSSIITRSGALHCIAQHVYDCSVDPSTTTSTTPGTTTATTTAATTTAATTTAATTTAATTTAATSTTTTSSSSTTTTTPGECVPLGDPCGANADCCSNKCKGGGPKGPSCK